MHTEFVCCDGRCCASHCSIYFSILINILKHYFYFTYFYLLTLLFVQLTAEGDRKRGDDI